jgi:threonyl-tRNA synthetase
VSEITVTVAGAARSVPAGSTAADLLDGDRGPDRSTVAARINGQLRDLTAAVSAGDAIEAVPIDSPDGRSILRHSTAHVMAQAVQDLFPGTLLGIGPPIDNGFYYDFAPHRPFAPDDLARIEKRMFEIV